MREEERRAGKRKRVSIAKYKEEYLLMLPFMALFFVFTVVPVLMSVILSFTDFNLLQWPSFVGWSNYIRLFLEDDVFMIAAKNTLVFALVTGPVSYFLCLLLAWFVNEFPPFLRTALTFLFYAPTISGNLYVMWTYIFSGDTYGLANGTLMKLGIISEPIAWLTDPKYMMPIIIVVQLWMSFGTGFLSFIAGLQGIDKSLYEAAAMDGVKNRWQELVCVTLPSMGPQLMFGAVMQISTSFSIGRVCMALAGNPSTDYAASTVISHLIDYGTVRYELGYASAIATVLFAAMLLVNEAVARILRNYTN